jgi:hypothetical protein
MVFPLCSFKSSVSKQVHNCDVRVCLSSSDSPWRHHGFKNSATSYKLLLLVLLLLLLSLLLLLLILLLLLRIIHSVRWDWSHLLLWKLDPFLGNYREVRNYTTAFTRQRSLNTNRGNLFYLWSVTICCKHDKLRGSVREDGIWGRNISHWEPLPSNG